MDGWADRGARDRGRHRTDSRGGGSTGQRDKGHGRDMTERDREGGMGDGQGGRGGTYRSRRGGRKGDSDPDTGQTGGQICGRRVRDARERHRRYGG